jgi:hypothetical protein
VDADFAAEVLEDLYTYPRKRRDLAFVLWLLTGWFGGHRFYVGRPLTGLAMLFTGGGGLFWWWIDGFFVASMVRKYNEDQERREAEGLPPRELDFMPPLSREVLAKPPEWTERWNASGAGRRSGRLVADIAVLVITAVVLGAVARSMGVYEAVLAVLALAGLTAAGGAASRLNHTPVIRGLIRWSHRLRLFYYYTKPGSPLALLFRPLTATIFAPFRRRDRAEVKLYLELGAIFTGLFLVLDLGGLFASKGFGALNPFSLLKLWIGESVSTFFVIYAFATPIGAVLTLHLLMRNTHTVPRLLSVVVVVALAIGLLS